MCVYNKTKKSIKERDICIEMVQSRVVTLWVKLLHVQLIDGVLKEGGLRVSKDVCSLCEALFDDERATPKRFKLSMD